MPRFHPLVAVSAGLCALLPGVVHAQVRAHLVVSGFSAPVGFVQDPSNGAVQYVVEQGGRIRVVANGVLQPADFLNLSGAVNFGGEEGLLGLAFPPDYAASGRFYVYYNDLASNIVLARYNRSAGNPLVADPSSVKRMRWGSPTGPESIAHPAGNHNGGQLAFGPDGYLYLGPGDGGGSGDPGHRAQDPTTLLGKILRIDVSVPDSDPQGYRVPPDNPFVDDIPVDALPEIWAFGLRNPWRFTFDDPNLGGTGALVIGDVGQNAREEIDYEPADSGGRNYGWRNFEGTLPFNQSLPPAFTPLVSPILDYPRDIGRSVTGGYVYRGTGLPPSLQGRYFYADFVTGRVFSVALSLDSNGEATVVNQIEHTVELGGLGNISSFGVDATGELYVVSYGGSVYRLMAPCTYAVSPSSLGFGHPGGSAGVSLTTQVGCAWSVTGGATWLSSNPANGVGAATITVTAAPNGSGPFRAATLLVAGLGVPVTQARVPPVRDVKGDLDGDRRADLTVFRPGNARWYTLRSSSQFMTAAEMTWGLGTDTPVARDYDGDGRLDFAVFRPSSGTWFALQSTTAFATAFSRNWGANGDRPVPADYDGDGRADLAVFRPGNTTWFVLQSSTGFSVAFARNWGLASDQLVPGDYDGDGRADLAVFRASNGNWFILQSSTGFGTSFVRNWGGTGDIAVPADYDGDGRTDIAVFRPANGTWYVLESWSGWTTSQGKQWGQSTDVPVPGDYDADGRADFAVFRPGNGTWYVSNQFGIRWGTNGDIAIRPQ